MNSDQKLDKIMEVVTEMRVQLERHSVLHEKNTEDLEEHIRRTNALEEKLAPVEKHVAMVETIFMTLMKIGAVVGAVVLGLNQLGLLKF